MEDFTKLLEVLKNIKGKFLLSSYPEEILLKYRAECGWNSKDIKQIVLVSGKREETKYKTECLTFNYPVPNAQGGLFDVPSEMESQEEESETEEEEIFTQEQRETAINVIKSITPKEDANN